MISEEEVAEEENAEEEVAEEEDAEEEDAEVSESFQGTSFLPFKYPFAAWFDLGAALKSFWIILKSFDLILSICLSCLLAFQLIFSLCKEVVFNKVGLKSESLIEENYEKK